MENLGLKELISTENHTIEIKNLSKFIIPKNQYNFKFGYRKSVFENLSFKIQTDNEHKILSILSPFGSGKTTLLKLIAGLEKASSGEIFLNDKLVNTPTNKIAFISTLSSSLPWLTVKENLELVFKINSQKIDEELINKVIKMVNLDGYENFIPNKNSIGFRLRISLARAIINQPFFILLDEPFSKLDYDTKNELYQLLKEIKNKLNITFIIATSSISEAIELSDKILIFNPNNFSEIISIDFIADYQEMKNIGELNYKEQIYNRIKNLIDVNFTNSFIL
ncbi:MAG: hypothetical protein STSR0008_02410 [Ignavibacterium sp.]